MSGVPPGQAARRRVPQQRAGAGDGELRHGLDQLVEQREQPARAGLGQRHAAQPVVQVGHRRGGGQAVPGDVADGQQQLVVAQREDRVPVPADAGRGAGRAVARGDLHPAARRLVAGRAGDDGLLERGGQLAFGVGAGALGGELDAGHLQAGLGAAPLGDVLDHADDAGRRLAVASRARIIPADRLGRHPHPGRLAAVVQDPELGLGGPALDGQCLDEAALGLGVVGMHGVGRPIDAGGVAQTRRVDDPQRLGGPGHTVAVDVPAPGPEAREPLQRAVGGDRVQRRRDGRPRPPSRRRPAPR